MASIYESLSIQNVSTKGPLTLTFTNILSYELSTMPKKKFWRKCFDGLFLKHKKEQSPHFVNDLHHFCCTFQCNIVLQ